MNQTFELNTVPRKGDALALQSAPVLTKNLRSGMSANDGCHLNTFNRDLYFSLSVQRPTEASLDISRRQLDYAVQEVVSLECDLPASAQELDAWIEQNTARVGKQYQSYLADRKAGGPRKYFTNKAHALYFLRGVAPTKSVDGAWLYGLVKHWNDGRFNSLIRIYLEELGNGLPDKNHVVLYKKLLASHGCQGWDDLPDSYFVQGVIQLGLAHHADHFLPEIIGFNLGYEQLPLHLLITSYELNELGIDPYYFTLHVTVDNADSGHAKDALVGLREAWPVVTDCDRFYERVASGYKLNLLGASTNAIIDSFDLDAELVSIFKRKSAEGRQVHSDYCRVAGRTINSWLQDSEQIPSFIAALEKAGWIIRNQNPENSRFWKLLEGDRAEMFGVFNAYELQVIYDWITGDGSSNIDNAPTKKTLTFKARQKLHETLDRRSNSASTLDGHDASRVVVNRSSEDYPSDFNAEVGALQSALDKTAGRDEAMDLLAHYISPVHHHTAVGLKATRLFSRMFG